MPRRLSLGPEDVKPSRWIAVVYWLAFILPVIFLWYAFQNPYLIGIVVVARIAIMFIPIGKKAKKEPVPVKATEPTPVPEKVNNSVSPLTPFIEEARSELGWFGHLFRKYIYDKNKEEKYLDDYRKIRGWK